MGLGDLICLSERLCKDSLYSNVSLQRSSVVSGRFTHLGSLLGHVRVAPKFLRVVGAIDNVFEDLEIVPARRTTTAEERSMATQIKKKKMFRKRRKKRTPCIDYIAVGVHEESRITYLLL